MNIATIMMTLIISYNVHASYIPEEIKNKAFNSERCTIRPSTILDYKKFYTLLTTPEVAKYQFGPELSAEEIEQIKTIPNKLKLLACVSNLLPCLGYRWMIEKQETGEIIGFIGFSVVDKTDYNFVDDKHYLNIAGARFPQFKDKGYWQEALRAILSRHAFSDDTVLLMAVNPENMQGCKVANTLKFNEVGMYRFDGNVLVQKPYTLKLFASKQKK